MLERSAVQRYFPRFRKFEKEMIPKSYIMESEEEAIRLDLKTDPETVKRHAIQAGLKPGMRVADLGCGPGKTSFFLNQLVGPGGSVVGVDISSQRIDFALSHYRQNGLSFLQADIREPLDHLGKFDFVWVRFVLEYYGSTSFNIVRSISTMLRKGGILCLIDLDYNCLTHYGASMKFEHSLIGAMKSLQEKADFDPYAGRRLYSYLYDLGYKRIEIDISAHHLIHGKLKQTDSYNWGKKIEIAAKNSGYLFNEYIEGFEGFRRECYTFFADHRRFTYTPLIVCSGRKP